ncbi:GUN4 domain-containing protein [Pseudanabaena biceps]|nr:GUN4 domain-containing protein [Pseudanabaena biceps]
MRSSIEEKNKQWQEFVDRIAKEALADNTRLVKICVAMCELSTKWTASTKEIQLAYDRIYGSNDPDKVARPDNEKTKIFSGFSKFIEDNTDLNQQCQQECKDAYDKLFRKDGRSRTEGLFKVLRFIYEQNLLPENNELQTKSQTIINPISKGSKTPSALPVHEIKKNPVELVSIKGIDYRELEELLKAQEWRKADELTAKLIHQFAYREKEVYLDSEKIVAFPCEDLRTIDQLWVHYSNGKFGFSIQKKLWLDCGGEIGEFDPKVFKKFASKVGWYHPQKDNWRTHTEFINDTKNTQNPLLASFPKMLRFYKGSGDGGYNDLTNGYLFSLSVIFSLAINCEL